MELLMNGDIYIKVAPEIIDVEKDIERIDEDIDNLKFEEANSGLTDEEIIDKENLEELKRILLSQENEADYENTDNFHLLKILEDRISIICYARRGEKHTTTCDLKKLKEKYIRLIDFLSEAQYIGKEFRRTEPLEISNIKITDYTKKEKGTTTKVLYKTDYAMLAEYKSKNSHYLEMIKPIYFEDKNYEFIGKKDNSYNDKKEIFKSVADEVENRYQYFKKYYENK